LSQNEGLNTSKRLQNLELNFWFSNASDDDDAGGGDIAGVACFVVGASRGKCDGEFCSNRHHMQRLTFRRLLEAPLNIVSRLLNIRYHCLHQLVQQQHRQQQQQLLPRRQYRRLSMSTWVYQ
jgi:hypothetical protein